MPSARWWGPRLIPKWWLIFKASSATKHGRSFQAAYGGLPDEVVACIGGGSNALGLFNAFLDDEAVALVGVEPAGEGLDKPGRHAATMTLGKPGVIQGFHCYFLQDEAGNPAAVHSIASGLDYPGVGPQHCQLEKDIGRARYESATDEECLAAFSGFVALKKALFPRSNPPTRSPRLRRAERLPADKRLLVNLSGRGDKDIDYVLRKSACELLGETGRHKAV